MAFRIRHAFGWARLQPAVLLDWRLRRLPGRVWGTKGLEFWTFLSLLLERSGCSNLLELGSGRSTLTLAEYAQARKARFVSIETSPEWEIKARLDLSWLGLSDHPVRLIGWNRTKSWYDEEQFRAAAGNDGYDFALIDAPNKTSGESEGVRDSQTALKEISRVIRDASVVVVDDVHRRHVFRSIDGMLDEPGGFDKWFYNYSVQSAVTNVLCICVRKGTQAGKALEDIRKFQGIDLYTAFTLENCAES